MVVNNAYVLWYQLISVLNFLSTCDGFIGMRPFDLKVR